MSISTSNLVRVVSITVVLVIHVGGYWELAFARSHDYPSSGFVVILLSQLGRFCVPVFVILSGFGLTVKYAGGAEFRFADFLRARLQRIALPYIVLSLVFLIASGRLSLSDPPGSGLVLVKALAIGSADYHMYFFAIILQCYLLYPLLHRLRSPLWLLPAAGLQILLAAPAAGCVQQLGLNLPPLHAAWFVYWLFYFQLGIWSAYNARAIRVRLEKHRGLASMAAVVTGCLVCAEYIYSSYQQSNPAYYNHFNRATVIAFAVSVWFSVFAWDQALSRLLSSGRLGMLVNAGAALSFFVYIWRVWVLRALRLSPIGDWALVLAVTLIGLSFVAASLADRLLIRPALIRRIVGLPG